MAAAKLFKLFFYIHIQFFSDRCRVGCTVRLCALNQVINHVLHQLLLLSVVVVDVGYLQTDIFSYAMTLYEIITLHRPMPNATETEIKRAYLNGNRPHLSRKVLNIDTVHARLSPIDHFFKIFKSTSGQC